MKLRPFELVLVIIFGVMGVLALVLLSTYKAPPDEKTAVLGSVTIWGTADAKAFYAMIRPLYETNESYRGIKYVQKDARNFDDEVLNALAEGVGPDLFFLPHEQIVAYRSKLEPIPYENFPRTDFQSRYIDGAEVFALNDGVYAFPVAVDPLMLYWNKDILATYNFLTPPTTWESMVNDYVPTLVNRDFSRTIIRSPLAFGEYRNVTNAFSVISMLLIQGGSAMVTEKTDGYLLQLDKLREGNGYPFLNALTFYTNFANPSNPLYTWNRTQDNDKQEFLGETLVFYFGKGSEAKTIAAQNPNLNFGIAEVPQGAAATNRRTYGSFYGLALLRSAKNKAGAYTVMSELSSAANSQSFANALGMAPVYRSTLMAGSNDTYGRMVYTSANVARGWLSPSPTATESIFTEMVEDVLANRAKPNEAVSDATRRLQEEY